MLYQLLQDGVTEWGSCEAVAWGGEVCTYARLAERADELAERLAELAGRKVGLALPMSADWVAAAAALDRLAARAFLLDGRLSDEELAGSTERFALSALLRGGEGNGDPSDPRVLLLPDGAADIDDGSSVVLLTSGTSGVPKAAVHTWGSLASGVRRRDELAGVRMLLAYDAIRYAGIQVLLTALACGARLTIPVDRDPAAIAEAMVRDGVEFASATPTFWRMLLANTDAEMRRLMPLRQITLGGERIDQPTLDMLARAFPEARITHIYASTEMGVCFSVHDRREGFPAEFLESDKLPVRLKVEGGRLWIRSNRAMAGYLGGDPVADQWFNTGDAVEVVGDRVHFRGRESSRINVGGQKVYPEEVEAVLREVDGVAEARVSSAESSIVGQLVQAEIQPASGTDTQQLTARVHEHCRNRLAGYKQPRLIKLVENLVSPDTMKVARRGPDPNE